MKNLMLAACSTLLMCIGINAEAANCTANSVSGDSATFVTQSVPASMEAGKTYAVSVTFCNNGTTNWIYQTAAAGSVQLGSQYPADNTTTWKLNRVNLSVGDNIAPGTLKTFNFSVTAPTPATAMQTFNFQFSMLRQQAVQPQTTWFAMGANQSVTSFLTPAVTLANKPTKPPVSVASGAPTAFSYTNFAGANLIGLQYALQTPNTHVNWIPNASQVAQIANQAKKMNLKYLRMTLLIPPDATDSEYVPSEWSWTNPASGATTNAINVNTTISLATAAMNAAGNAGMKIIWNLDGYTEYDIACTGSSGTPLWKKSFSAVKNNAATIIQALSSNSALYAWDLLNEPLWNAASYGCLDLDPTYSLFDWTTQTPQQTKLTLPSGSANLRSVTEVVEAVHAMYNVVRANDVYNHPTTVGEGTAAYDHYWSDISSFASPQLYVLPQTIISDQVNANKLVNTQLSANSAWRLPQFNQFTGAPLSASSWTITDPVIVSQVPAIASATLTVMKSEAVTAASTPLPLIVGEYGIGTSPQLSIAGQASYYSLYLPSLMGASQSGYPSVNIGGLFWDFQTYLQGPEFWLNNSSDNLVTPACTIASTLGASPLPTCYAQ